MKSVIRVGARRKTETTRGKDEEEPGTPSSKRLSAVLSILSLPAAKAGTCSMDIRATYTYTATGGFSNFWNCGKKRSTEAPNIQMKGTNAIMYRFARFAFTTLPIRAIVHSA